MGYDCSNRSFRNTARCLAAIRWIADGEHEFPFDEDLLAAYGYSAGLALEEAPRRDVWLEAETTICTTYGDLGIVEATLAQQEAIVRRCDRDFGDVPVFRVATLVSRADGLRQVLVEATAGRAETGIPDRPSSLPGGRCTRGGEEGATDAPERSDLDILVAP